MRTRIVLILLAAAVAGLAQQSYDLVVYGGTAGGVMTAVAGARQGLRTVLIEPRAHVGGMATGGLSRTDVGRREVIGGLALEFYMRIGERYEMHRFLHEMGWQYEPRVGESVMREMLKNAGVDVVFNRRLREKTGVVKQGNTVTGIVMQNGETYRGKVFADCTYEGDLMAQAKVTYTYGRESVAQYGESLAGIRERTPYHQFQVDIPARDAQGNLLPEITTEPRGVAGAADHRIQAYNFRLITTNNPAIRRPWPKPANYDAKRYELLARMVVAMQAKLGRAQILNEVTQLAEIPNRKADFNNSGAFSTDYIGKNYDYPDGSYAVRERIWQEHIDYVKGYFYFLANDPRVPAALQREVRQWGLAKDEFEDTDNWPHQLYIREARRMVGEYVLVQKDMQTDLMKPDVIGMGSYNSDSHNVRRFVNEKGFAENEGDMQVAVKPYQIPYRMLLPKRAEAANLLVPVCFSASHVAYSSARMEPQYMILGHAAGVAASLAVRAAKPVQDISVSDLQKTLKTQGAVFEYAPNQQQNALGILHRLLSKPGPRDIDW
ncbi:MAG: FAD-dependent oxidoreductase [Acidobacteriales bacterium]|nr:FAD-dependent oxidoreductase [Terriglobales bacterium]